MRAPVPFSSWLKLTSLLFVAPTSFTGTWTRPKLIAPVQIALGIGSHPTYGRPAPQSPDSERESLDRGRGARHRRRPRAHAFQPRQAAVPGGRIPQSRRHRLLPPRRAGHAPAPRGTAADARTRARRRGRGTVLR